VRPDAPRVFIYWSETRAARRQDKSRQGKKRNISNWAFRVGVMSYVERQNERCGYAGIFGNRKCGRRHSTGRNTQTG
jgi:hypothetical protein